MMIMMKMIMMMMMRVRMIMMMTMNMTTTEIMRILTELFSVKFVETIGQLFINPCSSVSSLAWLVSKGAERSDAQRWVL